MSTKTIGGAIAVLLSCGAAASPFAIDVVSYDQGSNPFGDYTDPTTALGDIERFTGEGVFPSAVTPFNPAFGTDEIVSIGSGGQLTLELGRAITNDASHQFGVDLIVFSNSSFADTTYFDEDPFNDGTGFTGASPFVFGAGGEATIQVSADGDTWETAAITTLDLLPTLGYLDFNPADPFAAGLIETDPTVAMDPSLTLADFANLSFAQIRDLYGRSAGGIGIDISSTGLASASFVRFVNNSDSAFEIDAVSVVPAPGAIGMLTLAAGLVTRRRRV